MTYQETLDYIYKKLPAYQRVGASAFKKDLTNIKALCKSLGNPQNTFKSIHIAGTNGKGSVSNMLSALLQKNNYKTGLYTSPHLIDFRERIRINGRMVSKNFVIQFVDKIAPVIEDYKPSFFEITVAMAFDYFHHKKVDIAIIETGLGGRLDSTNIISPILSVITNISLDHTEMLGETLQEIAFEKAGIIKQNTPLVLGEIQESLQPIFSEKATKLDAPIYNAASSQIQVEAYPSDLKGLYQKKNIATALTCIDVLNKHANYQLNPIKVKQALLNVAGLTGLRGRWETVNNKPLTICDTGHNEAAMSYLGKQLNSLKTSQIHVVIGMVKEKKPKTLLKLLPKNAKYYICQPSIFRALSVEKLTKLVDELGLNYTEYPTVKAAYSSAVKNAKKTDTIFIGGSTFVVADFLEIL